MAPLKYSKGELIGSGAYGKVYQGLDTTNGSLLAIKNINVSILSYLLVFSWQRSIAQRN